MVGVTRFLKEARRRRVFRVAGLYIVAAWIVVQVFSEIFPAIDIPAGAIRYVWLGALIGLPIAVVLGWFYDVTVDGIVRTAPARAGEYVDLRLRKSDYIILTAIAIAASIAVIQLSSRISDQGMLVMPRPGETTDRISIGVLPLDNLSNDPDQAYFVNGIHDALIFELSRISSLQVTSKTSARAYVETAKSIEIICRELAISKVIQGSVLRVDDDVQVNIRLSECASDAPMWSESYERRLSDVLIMQSDITRSVANAVEVVLSKEEAELLARARAVDPAAYESYLRGMFHLELITPQDMQFAEELFTRSLEFDRNNALAHWGLGRACRFQLQFGLGIPNEREPECRGHQLKALAIDPELPQVHLGLALGYWLYDYDWNAADTSFRRALELNPNYAEAYMFYSHFLAHVSRWQASDLNIQRAVELDPLNIFVLGLHFAQQHLTGRLEQAVEGLSRLHAEVPGFGFGYDVLWYSNFKLGDLDAAIEAAKNHFSVTMGMPDLVDDIERSYARIGFEGAMLELGTKLEILAERQYIQGSFVAIPFAMAGNVDKAVQWLEVAIEQHDPMMPYIGTMAGVAKISKDPRYARILDKMNLSLPDE